MGDFGTHAARVLQAPEAGTPASDAQSRNDWHLVILNHRAVPLGNNDRALTADGMRFGRRVR